MRGCQLATPPKLKLQAANGHTGNARWQALLCRLSEDPELRPRITAVLQALGEVEKVFRKHAEVYRAEELKSATTIAPPLAPQ
jgi:hypothetical protein